MFGFALSAAGQNNDPSKHIPKNPTNSNSTKTTTYSSSTYSYGSNQPQQGSFGGSFADSFGVKPQPFGGNGTYTQTTTTYTNGSQPSITTMVFDAPPSAFADFPGFGGNVGIPSGFGGNNGKDHPTFNIGGNNNFNIGGNTGNFGFDTKPIPGYNPQPQPQPIPGYGGFNGNAQPSQQPTYPSYNGYNQPTQPSKPTMTQDQIRDLAQPGKQMFLGAFSRNCREPDSQYMALLEQLKASGRKYRDQDFPPELRSLTGGLSDYELAQNSDLDWRSIIWRRADDIFGAGTYKVFEDKIEPADIIQGSLGDCYFLSTLAALAEKPRRIRKLFESHRPNEQGCYGVRVCNMGIWTTYVMDDYIPCSASTKKPIFTRSNGKELWVVLLEKAWAKIYGSYARIEAGLTRECLHDLTGAPTKYYLTGDNQKKNEEIWQELVKGEQKDFVMTCGSGDYYQGADLMGSAGLVGSHAYSLLSAVTVKDRYGRDVRLVKLRNPWGQGEWKGAWSDNSSTWTPELRKQLNVEKADDGIFYMQYEEMLKYFSDIQICKVHDDYKYSSLRSNCDHIHPVYFNLTVREAGHYYITINQESKRMRKERENYQYSEVSVVFGRKVGNGFEYVEGIQRADKEVWTDGPMEVGEYVVYVKIHWNEERNKEFSISAYGIGDVDIQQIPATACPDFVEKVYISKGRQSTKKEDYQHCGVRNCYRTVEITDDGFGFIYYKNESNKTLEEEIYFKVMEGLKLKKPYSGNNYKINVPPGQERIVITKVLPNARTIRQAFTERSRFI